jgi:hypothetical protein
VTISTVNARPSSAVESPSTCFDSGIMNSRNICLLKSN